ncbi:hypothetical protein HK096_001743, partial [Nowakowskiella sp. JEL0078]
MATKFIYGTAWKKAQTSYLVSQALSSGFLAVDTACQPKHYNERGVGEGIAIFLAANPEFKREALWIQTKFSPLSAHAGSETPYDPNSPLETQIAESVKMSLENLKIDYIDSLVLHSPMTTHFYTM